MTLETRSELKRERVRAGAILTGKSYPVTVKTPKREIGKLWKRRAKTESYQHLGFVAGGQSGDARNGNSANQQKEIDKYI